MLAGTKDINTLKEPCCKNPTCNDDIFGQNGGNDGGGDDDWLLSHSVRARVQTLFSWEKERGKQGGKGGTEGGTTAIAASGQINFRRSHRNNETTFYGKRILHSLASFTRSNGPRFFDTWSWSLRRVVVVHGDKTCLALSFVDFDLDCPAAMPNVVPNHWPPCTKSPSHK